MFSADEKTRLHSIVLEDKHVQYIDIGKRAVINLISIPFDEPLAEETLYAYNFIFSDTNLTGSLAESLAEQLPKSLPKLMPELLYPGCSYPNFVIKNQLKHMLHGSCRKPHFDSDDGLVQVDKVLEKTKDDIDNRPAMLMMTGDQIYADDVAGPMLSAIHQVIKLLGLHDESWQGTTLNNSEALFSSDLCYYQRDLLLPMCNGNEDDDSVSSSKAVYKKLFTASKKPIFTTVHAKNHLVTLSEVLAMYILVWSPAMWRLVDLDETSSSTPNILPTYKDIYQKEKEIIAGFVASLPHVARAFAHLPVYMIFDDHDVTDDWNLTRGWEETAYGHPFSKRIIGNALIGYWLCQGWGNCPEKFTELNDKAKQYFTAGSFEKQDQLIDDLMLWDQWHYHLETSPKVIVLDTRTQRWRSESNANKPSGLMDWEALSLLQQSLINQPDIILVSPAPIYGVKMIETIQRFFTFLGLPLMVDAENWMAHSGTANVMLNIFRHKKTPPHFIILSGDVHYSFFYEVTHRFRRNKSRIFQITASGIKNQFPTKLLNILETLNRYLYGVYSPLNWFTKRRRMKVRVRKPQHERKAAQNKATPNKTLVNRSAIGLITLTHDELVVKAELLTVDDERILFHPLKKKK